MFHKAVLYPIIDIARPWVDEAFDVSALPVQIDEQTAVEDVATFLPRDEIDLFSRFLSERDLDAIKGVRFAIVHRYSSPSLDNPEDKAAEQCVLKMAACLRLIRPMRQTASFIRGKVGPDCKLQIERFENPSHLMEVPDVQRLFCLRNRDVERLRRVVPEFLRAMGGEFWKFRMAVELHEAGHFSDSYWKGRFSLWCAAVEALFTSQNPRHQGSAVAKARIKWFLQPKTRIYPPGDIQSLAEQSNIMIEDITDDLYELRNSVAHGDKTADKFYEPRRTGLDREIKLVEILHEALSFIIRASLLRILEEGLLDDFANGPASETYFAKAGLLGR